MGVAPINLCADLLAWQNTGLSFLLLDDMEGEKGTSAFDAISHELTKNQSTNRLKSFSPSPSASFKPPQEAAKSPVLVGNKQANKEQDTALASNRKPEQQAEVSKTTAISRPNMGAKEHPPIKDWPIAWVKLFQKNTASPIAWSYPELGEDLLIKGDLGRSQTLKTLIGALKLKRGSSFFWPPFLPQEGQAQALDDKTYFHAGLDLLKASALIVFGKKTLEKTNYAHLSINSFKDQVCNGRLIIMLPPISELVLEPSRLGGVECFLSAALRQFNLTSNG